MKKLPAILAAAALSLTLAACGGGVGDALPDDTSTITDGPSPSPSDTETATDGPTTPDPDAEPQVWDAATSTMTLTNAKLSKELKIDGDEVTLKLVGDNEITVDSTTADSVYGVRADGNLKIEGDGNLTIKVHSTQGNTGGVSANRSTIDIGKDSTISIDSSSDKKSARGIWTAWGVNLTSGTIDLKAATTSPEHPTFAVFADKGHINVDKDFTLKGSLTGTNNGGDILYAQNGNVRINGKIDLAMKAPGSMIGVRAGEGIEVGDGADVKFDLESTDSWVYGMAAYNADLNVKNAKVDLTLTGLTQVGGIAPGKGMTLDGMDLTAKITSTSPTETKHESKDAAGKTTLVIDRVYAIVGWGGSQIKNSNLNIDVKSGGNEAYGLYSFRPLTLSDTKVQINVNAAPGYAFGIAGMYENTSGTGSKTALTLKSVSGPVTTSNMAILSYGDMVLDKTSDANGKTVKTDQNGTTFYDSKGMAYDLELQAK